jgi:hypothetical protein
VYGRGIVEGRGCVVVLGGNRKREGEKETEVERRWRKMNEEDWTGMKKREGGRGRES